MSGDFVYHEKAIIDDGVTILPGTRVWAFAHLQAGSEVGAGCNIGEGVFIEKGAVVGNNVTIKNGVQIWDGVFLENDVFVGPNATFCNDKYPRSKQHLEKNLETRVCSNASIGANATILPGVTIGAGAMVGAGSVVTHNVSSYTVVAGNPARHLGFINAIKKEIKNSGSEYSELTMIPSRCSSSYPVRLVSSPVISDRRGKLTFTEHKNSLPWICRRNFIIYDTPERELRGYHAHKTTHQCLICVAGRIIVLVDNGVNRIEVELDSPNKSLLIPPMVWSSQTYVKPGSVLVVLASEKHIPENYIHDYSQFLSLSNQFAESGTRNKCEVEEEIELEESIIRVPFLDIKGINKPLETQFTAAFSRVLESGCFILGPEVEAFEHEWSAYCHADHCVGVGSGLAALHLLLVAAGVKPHHEVIVPSNTYIATVLAISQTGATPVFVEPNPLTHTLDASGLCAAITKNTHSIMTVDLYGQTSDMDPILVIAKQYGVFVFSDSAQGHGARYKGRITGSLCDASCFSFYPSKNLGALGEAGAVVTNNADLANRVRILRNYGSSTRYYNEFKGFNERMDPVQAAFLRCKIPHLDYLNCKRSYIASCYMKSLANISWLTLPLVPEWSSPCWHLFVIFVHGCRDALSEYLTKNQVDSIVHYPVPPHLQECYKDLNLKKGSFPVAEKLAGGVISIPICPTLSDEQVGHVVKTIISFEPDQQAPNMSLV